MICVIAGDNELYNFFFNIIAAITQKKTKTPATSDVLTSANKQEKCCWHLSFGIIVIFCF